MTTRCNSADTF